LQQKAPDEQIPQRMAVLELTANFNSQRTTTGTVFRTSAFIQASWTKRRTPAIGGRTFASVWVSRKWFACCAHCGGKMQCPPAESGVPLPNH